LRQLNIFKITSLLALVVLLSGCLKQNPAPISWIKYGRGWYIVKKGDTLYSIARKYNKSFANIAKNNNIRSPYTLWVGQKIKINNSQVVTKPVIKKSVVSVKPVKKSQHKLLPSSQAKAQPKLTPKQNTNLVVKDYIKWGWPAKGDVSGKFVQGQVKQNGIAITNMLGTPVCAAADGVVIYSGDALRGYGNLIIIKHDKNYLTAYAHNQKIIVKEKDTVKLGQQIASMGSSGTDKVKLHFEIRYHGKPLDPIKLLP
jgi:lipoprotein NlpD